MITLAIAALLQALPVTELASQPSGGGSVPQEQVIRERAAFEERWKASVRPVSPPPGIDFEKESVIFVTLGQKPTGGYSVKVTGAELKDGEAVVTVRRKKPEGAAVTVLTHPFTLVKVPKLPEKVGFVEAKD